MTCIHLWHSNSMMWYSWKWLYVCDFSIPMKRIQFKRNRASGGLALKPASETVMHTGRARISVCEAVSRTSHITIISVHNSVSSASGGRANAGTTQLSASRTAVGSHVNVPAAQNCPPRLLKVLPPSYTSTASQANNWMPLVFLFFS